VLEKKNLKVLGKSAKSKNKAPQTFWWIGSV
jgi:hypothetical protein